MRVYAPKINDLEIEAISEKYIKEIIQKRRNEYRLRQLMEKEVELQKNLIT